MTPVRLSPRAERQGTGCLLKVLLSHAGCTDHVHGSYAHLTKVNGRCEMLVILNDARDRSEGARADAHTMTWRLVGAKGLGGLESAAKHPLRLGTNGRQAHRLGPQQARLSGSQGCPGTILHQGLHSLFNKTVPGWRSTCMRGPEQMTPGCRWLLMAAAASLRLWPRAGTKHPVRTRASSQQGMGHGLL